MSRESDAAGSIPPLPDGVRAIREIPAPVDLPLHVHPEWSASLSWLIQGTTGRGSGEYDFGLFGDQPVGPALRRWRRLREAAALPRAVHSLQVHRAEVLAHDEGPPGLLVTEGYDGHRTGRPGTLLTVSVADCVPIFLVDRDHRAVALLHGGWRGTAAGVLGRGVRAIAPQGASRLEVHLGPAICGACYEVGPEVHRALGLEPPPAPTPVDVRAVQARQAIELGVAPDRITISEHCTRCGDLFFSHRGGDAARQLGVLGIRP